MIKGKKVVLRPIREEDFPLLHQWINDPQVARSILRDESKRTK